MVAGHRSREFPLKVMFYRVSSVDTISGRNGVQALSIESCCSAEPIIDARSLPSHPFITVCRDDFDTWQLHLVAFPSITADPDVIHE